MPFKANNEYWNELEAKGWLYSYLKDGVPESFISQIIGYSYPIILFIIIILTFALYSKLPEEKKHFKSMIASVGTATLLGWIWGAWLFHANPTYLGWFFPPWAVTNIEFILTLEDWVFYPACTALFYTIYRHIELDDNTSNRTLVINIIIVIYIFTILFYLLFTALCGRSIAVLFAIPGLLLFIYARDVLNVRKFIYFLVIVVSMNCVWDWAAVSWVHSIDGYAWASQWIYVSFNKTGEHIQSTIYLDYVEHAWAWIFNNPIEITPWLGLSGAILDFSLFAAADKFFARHIDIPTHI